MTSPSKLIAALAALAVLSAPARADGPYHNQDNRNPNDPAEGSYPVPYHKPTVAEITQTLERIRIYLDAQTPTRIVHQGSGTPVTDLREPAADAVVQGAAADFDLQAYEMGVVHAGMLKATEVTGDRRFADLSARHFQFFADTLPYFRAQEARFHLGRANSFARFLDPRQLDDAGSMCAAMMRARRAGVGPDLSSQIKVCGDWVAKRQLRLADGTFARPRPQALSLWADDMYMGIPALAELGRMTGERGYYDDAVKNVLQFSSYLFNPQAGLYTHGWHADNPDAPQFYWGRANGWAVLTMSDLLDVLPKDHPGYPKVLAQLRLALRGIAQLQSGSGLWHQMLDRSDSYLETSASAIFTYVIAHAVNQGWVSPISYGPIAQAGWIGVATRVNAQGQVEGTCVGTTLAGDQVYYYNRPASPLALHGYGPTLLAGAEVMRMLGNPAFDVKYTLRTYQYMPRAQPHH